MTTSLPMLWPFPMVLAVIFTEVSARTDLAPAIFIPRRPQPDHRPNRADDQRGGEPGERDRSNHGHAEDFL